MWVRVTVFRGDPERVDAGIVFVRDEVLPYTSKMKGSLGLAMGVDRSSGWAAVLTCWADRASLDASHQAVVARRAAAGRRIGSGETTVELFEVIGMDDHLPDRPEDLWARVTRFEPTADLDTAASSLLGDAVPTFSALDGAAVILGMVDRENGVVQSLEAFTGYDALVAARGATPGGQAASEIHEMELALFELTMPS
jgi:hypothetical protein